MCSSEGLTLRLHLYLAALLSKTNPIQSNLILPKCCLPPASCCCLYLAIGTQVEVSTYFQVCSHLFLRCSGAGKPHSLRKEYAHTAEEIACLSKIQSAWCGDSTVGCGASAGVRVTGQNARASSGRNADAVAVEADSSSSSSSSALRRFIEIAGQLLLTASTSAQGDSKHSAGKNSVTLRSIAEFESDAESLLSPSPSAVQSSCPQSSPIIQFALSPALKAWIALLAAKTFLCVFTEHQKAYMWVRRALAYVAPRSSDAPKLGGMGSEGASCLAVDRCLPRLEVQYVHLTVTSASV